MNIDTVSLTISEMIALPEVEVNTDAALDWALQFWAGLYASRSERASIALKEYDRAIDDEKSYAAIEQLWQIFVMLDSAAMDAGRQLDAAKAAILARRN